MAKRTLRTSLCDILGIEYPILSAGMGPALLGERTGAPVELVVAVSEAGGCGVLGAAGLSLDELRDQIRRIKSLTGKPFGVDLLLPRALVERSGEAEEAQMMGAELTRMKFSAVLAGLPQAHREWVEKVMVEMDLPDVDFTLNRRSTTSLPRHAVKVCLEERVPLFCAGLGSPGFMVNDAHAVGTKVLAITGNVKNGRRMAREGIDLLVAQGHEGGGHTGRIGTMALLPQVLDAAAPVPVLAAGGIGDGRGLAAALAMGCIGVWVGTRFLATVEGGALEANKQRIVDSTDEDTRVSLAYTGKTSRSSYSRFHDLWNDSGLPALPFPNQALISSALLASFLEAGKLDYVGGFAGQISGLIQDLPPAAQVLDEMVDEAVDILTRRLPQTVIAK
jgi:NAD(P)H-dependent flavin oxidoreductase YrpB (nitropropane dioxygenase family)